MYICSCFGVTEREVREHAESGACTPRQIASASRAGTDCGSCVRRIQGLLGRGGCARGAEQLPRAAMGPPESVNVSRPAAAEYPSKVAEAV